MVSFFDVTNRLIFAPKDSHQYSDQNSWRILMTSRLKFINWLHNYLKNKQILMELLKELPNHLMYWPLKFPKSNLTKILEEFCYCCFSNQNSDRNSWRVVWLYDFLKNSENIFLTQIYQLFQLAKIIFSNLNSDQNSWKIP